MISHISMNIDIKNGEHREVFEFIQTSSGI